MVVDDYIVTSTSRFCLRVHLFVCLSVSFLSVFTISLNGPSLKRSLWVGLINRRSNQVFVKYMDQICGTKFFSSSYYIRTNKRIYMKFVYVGRVWPKEVMITFWKRSWLIFAKGIKLKLSQGVNTPPQIIYQC